MASLPLALVAAGHGDATIGALMGVAALVQVPAAFVAGGLIDRFGGRSIFLVSTLAFLLAAALLAAGLASPTGPLTMLVLVRVLQGIGLAACLPAALSLVPGQVRPTALATGLSIVQLGANISGAITPPASVAILQASSIQVVSIAMMVSVSLSVVLAWWFRPGPATVASLGETERLDGGAADLEAVVEESRSAAMPSRWRAFRPAWRREWALILGLAVLYVVHWGVITGYLPQRAAGAGADVGLLFTADALSLIALRLPFAWLADRVGPHLLMVGGLAITLVALAILAVPPTTPLLVLAGLATGSGAALVLPPATVVLSNRSDDGNRGSAFALYSVAFAVGIAIGSIGLSPFIDGMGFDAALAIGALGLCAAILLAVADRRAFPAVRTAPAG